ncbi:ATP-binding cassette domain-containing protein [Hominifimenecus sp. rT4P-3]|uniref:ATP-binding cassette domain-containing protein n=1 Tax=Hominifimenecus sp. rT4P-3 TaxID=3242979 RepID=UPI003DA54BA9
MEIRMEKVTQRAPSGRLVFNKINLSAAEGRSVLIQGENGSGKTMLLQMLCGKQFPSEGRVTVDGEDWRFMSELRRGRLCRKLFGIVGQNPNFIRALTLEENLLLPLEFRGGGRAARKRRVREEANALGIEHLLEKYPEALSDKERRLAGAARALLLSPKFLLVDDFLEGLMGAERIEMEEALRKAELRKGITSIRTAGTGDSEYFGEARYILCGGRLYPGESIFNRGSRID